MSRKKQGQVSDTERSSSVKVSEVCILAEERFYLAL